MAKSLVIVESNAKIKTIGKLLGKNYQVLSSVGHVKDLPKQRLGVNLDDKFEPEYITIRGKGKILNQLRKSASTAERIYIATDPDREGEAIAYHLAEEMKVNRHKIHRVMFNEITARAVLAALENPTKINHNRVAAQKARRVMDRLVGYKVSPILWRTVYRGLSAGRVQSVALRLICEREEEIDRFVPVEYWTVTVELQGHATEPFLAKLIKIDDKPLALANEKETAVVVTEIKKSEFRVKSVKRKTVARKPQPPFTTSTMQQAAANRLGYSAKKIMMIAQQLYEGVELGSQGSVGLITYMRTDSTRISDEALQSVREYVFVNYGKEYLPAKPKRFKVKSGAQDAHEAIRPTSFKLEPRKIRRYLTAEQFKLYELIWNRFVACQMADAKLDQTTIDISAGKAFLFRTTGSVIVFRGFLQIYGDFTEDNGKQAKSDSLYIPGNLTEDELLKLLKVDPQQHFTKPSPRFSESSLIKELDTLGIGRPSTYATIIATILTRKYVEKEQRQLVPTDLGKTVKMILVQNFPSLFNVEFTAHMEDDLDKIESGEKEFLQVTKEFYEPFQNALNDANSRQGEIKHSLQEQTEEKCPNCQGDLIIRWGRNGKFMACKSYPDCKYTKPLEAPEEVEDKCRKCGSNMVVKFGRFGRFLACSAYPKCKNTQPFSIGIKCSNDGCDGMIVEKKSRRGRVFYGCSNYPECKFATWNKPINQPCSNCNSPYMELRSTKAKGDFVSCPICKTEHQVDEKESHREIAYG